MLTLELSLFPQMRGTFKDGYRGHVENIYATLGYIGFRVYPNLCGTFFWGGGEGGGVVPRKIITC